MTTVGELFQEVATSGFAIGAMFGLDGRDRCLCPDRYNCTLAGQHAIAGDVECETSAEIIANGRRYGAVAVPRIDLRRNGLIGISVDLNDQEGFATLQRLLGVLPSMLVIARRIGEPPQPGQRCGRMVNQIVYVFRADHADRSALKSAYLRARWCTVTAPSHRCCMGYSNGIATPILRALM